MEEHSILLSTPKQNRELTRTTVAKNSCYTKLAVIPYSYTWTIDNFSLRPEIMGECLTSPTFPDGAKEKFKWCLLVYPKGRNEECREFLTLAVRAVSHPENEIRTKIKFTVRNTSGREINTKESSIIVFSEESSTFCCSKFVHTDFLLNKERGKLFDDKLIIIFEIRVITGSIDIPGKANPVPIQSPERCLSEDLEPLLENPQFSDVILSVGGTELQAHKGILVARSPVFQAMFQHQMEENKSNHVDITDVDYEVLREMLRFIYTGKVPNLEDMAYDLLKAADKYALEGLKVLCEQHLCANNLTIDNAAELLVLADLHSAIHLKAQTMDFIKSHALDVMDTSGWKSMTVSNQHLIIDICRVLATQ